MEKQNLPNATAVLVLGILSILTCCCFGIVGLIFGIVALLLARKDMKLYRESPELYSNYGNLNSGRIVAIIGVVISALTMLYIIFVFANLTDEEWQEIKYEYNKAYEEAQRNRH
ncbi:MAG TPA: CCC motif membrane protein [Flavobacterium sp.]|nr:CCC motif membrane protein [Flavobacterium sp.]